MTEEYKLAYEAEEIDELLGKAARAVQPEDLAGMDAKLDTIMASVNSGFRMEQGTHVESEGFTATSTVSIPCSDGAKAFEFYADAETLERIKATTGTRYSAGVACNFYATGLPGGVVGGTLSNPNYVLKGIDNVMTDMTGINMGWVLDNSTAQCSNESGVTFKIRALLPGTYKWRALYWND